MTRGLGEFDSGYYGWRVVIAAIEGPETIAGKLVYKFVRAIGAKG